MSIRERVLDRKVKFPESKIKGTPYIWRQASERHYKGKQKTASEGHASSRDRFGKYHAGGEFFTFAIRPEINTRHVSLKGNVAWGQMIYNGPMMVAGVPTTMGVADPSSSHKHLDSWGAKAIAAVDPTNPNAQTGISLGEIVRDRKIPIPGIQAWRQRTQLAKAAGSEFLNAQFGWLPLVDDMKNTAQSVLDGNTIIDNYRAASGTLVHREFAFPDSRSETEDIIGSNVANCGATYNELGSVVPIVRRSVSTTKRWFSGSFTYYAHQGNSLKRCLGIGTEAEKLFSASLNPELVWELTPWSWAVDWFSNAGEVISNVNSFALAGLVMQYGYIMEESSTTVTYSMPDSGYPGVGKVPDSSWSLTTKRRKEANPFGFGVEWEGLSPTQLAITAALGITRMR